VFDFSFSELVVVAVVALIVIGPEKLPKVARTLGAFIGRIQRYMAQIKDEVNREVRFEELQKLQDEIKTQVSSAATEAESLVQNHVEDTKQLLEGEVLVPIKRKSPKLSQFSQMPEKIDFAAKSTDTLADVAPVKKKAVKKAAVNSDAIKKTPTKRAVKPKPVA
jgi:sec-independent protein translocase protein TatB